MTPSLPVRPDLEQLRRQAKELLKAHRSGDPSCCETFRHLGRFAESSDAELLGATLQLSDAQHALAKSYGFRNWAEVKRAVDADRSADKAVPVTFRYAAVNSDRSLVSGSLEATGFDDFAQQLKDLGLIAVSVSAGESPGAQGADAGRHLVDVVLLQLVRLGWVQARFHCAGPQARFGLLLTEDWEPGEPFPTEVPGVALLTTLRELAGEPGLGQRTLRVPVRATLGDGLPGARPRTVDLRLESEAGKPGQVGITICLPGSDGPVLAREERIVDLICQHHGEQGALHVLTSREETAERLASELSRRLGPEAVCLMRQEAKELPGATLVVSTAAEMCFIYMRACWDGPEARDGMERRLAGLMAVCVNVSRQYAQTPCQFRDPDDNVTLDVRIAPFLMLYGRVVEFGQA